MARRLSIRAFLLVAFVPLCADGQVPVVYRLSFPEAAHHLMQVEATFADIPAGPLELRMSRSSPGRCTPPIPRSSNSRARPPRLRFRSVMSSWKEIVDFGQGFFQVTLHYGFMQEPDVEAGLMSLHDERLPMRTRN